MSQHPTMPFRTPQQDLLKEWYKAVRLANSVFARRRTIDINETHLARTEESLREFFGDEYLQPEPMKVMVPNIQAKDSHWFFQLLVSDDYPSLAHVFEVDYLLTFISNFDPKFHDTIKGLKEKQGFRNYLFETLIYETLQRNQVEFAHKQVINRKEKEGIITLNKQQVLFECKKLYTDQLPILDFVANIHTVFFNLWNKRAFPLQAIISITNVTEPLMRKARPVYEEHFKAYMQQHRETGDAFYRKKVHVGGKEIGEIYFDKYNLGIFESEWELSTDGAVGFTIHPSSIKTVTDPNVTELHENNKSAVKYVDEESGEEGLYLQYFPLHLMFKIHSLQNDCLELFLQEIDRKRHSQRDMKDMPRIFFFDNEVYRGQELPLFHNLNTIDHCRIQAFVEENTTDDIVCLVYRDYSPNNLPTWTFKVYCKEELNWIKQEIESWTLLYRDHSFVNTLPKKR